MAHEPDIPGRLDEDDENKCQNELDSSIQHSISQVTVTIKPYAEV